MTDKEIIKALECCLSGKEELCKECPLNGKCYGDIDYLLELTLDLINRQQEQLEAAANGQETLQKALAEKNVEIERLNNNLSAMPVTTNNSAEATNKEAIKTIKIAIAETEFRGYSKAYLTAFKTAVEALEKQNPKKVKQTFKNDYDLVYCPRCGVRFIQYGKPFCGECGQALDWSERNGDEEND